MNLKETLANIKAVDPDVAEQCRTHWNNVAKPLYSLGKLETLTTKIGAAQGKELLSVKKRRVLVFCADNGVVEEGVSQSDHSVTTAVAKSLVEGTSNVNLMAKAVGADVKVFDVGMVDDLPELPPQKLIHGTANLAKMPAMTEAETFFAAEIGIRAALQAKAEGMDLVVIGEMGIGNTTSAAAVIAAMLQTDPANITGRGSGLSDEGLARKVNAIRSCLEVNQPDPERPLDVLAKAGGADIAAMVGVILACAGCQMPVVLDGLITIAAALIAKKVDPRTLDYMIPSHTSKEPGAAMAMKALGLSAPIDADLALGEGTGGVMLLPMLDLAMTLYQGEHSFDSIGIDAYK